MIKKIITEIEWTHTDRDGNVIDRGTETSETRTEEKTET
jgi:hypothetical protein